MNIRGIDKTSLIDYPGKICAVFFCGGCNLRCGFCHNPDIVLNSHNLALISNDEALSFLHKRRKLIDGVTLSGGEPTMSSSLIPFVRKIKKMSLLVKLDTNGLNPSIVADLIKENLVDYAAIDVKTSPEKYQHLTDTNVDFSLVLNSIEILKNSGIDYELRTTCVPGFAEMQDIVGIMDSIKSVKRYYLQQFISRVPLVDVKYASILPYSAGYLMQLKKYISKFAEICEIRGI